MRSIHNYISELSSSLSYFYPLTITDHHTLYYTYLFIYGLFTYTHRDTYKIIHSMRSELFVLFTAASTVPRAGVGILTNICSWKEGKKGRQKDERNVKGRGGGTRSRRARGKFLAWPFSRLRYLAALPALSFHNSPIFFLHVLFSGPKLIWMCFSSL